MDPLLPGVQMVAYNGKQETCFRLAASNQLRFLIFLKDLHDYMLNRSEQLSAIQYIQSPCPPNEPGAHNLVAVSFNSVSK